MEITFQKLISNRVRKGYDKVTSVVILNQILISHSGSNLEHALCYNGFATESQAAKFVAEVK